MSANISVVGLFVSVSTLLSAYCFSEGLFPRFFSTKTDTRRTVNLSKFPMEFTSWKGKESSKLSDTELRVLNLDSWLRREYTNTDGHSILLYAGYWKHQTGDSQAAKHSPLLCLPSNGWSIRDIQVRPVTSLGDFSSKSGILSSVRLIAEMANQVTVVYFWFFSSNKTYTSDFGAIFNTGINEIVHGRSDGGIVEITVPVEVVKGNLDTSIEYSDLIAERFIVDFYPLFWNFVSQ